MTAAMPDHFEHVVSGGAPPSIHDLQLDGTKIGWYRQRVEAWRRGEKIAPITMDVAWTRKCAAACNFCVFPDTPILMADGSTRPMIEVCVGDRIASVDKAGKPAVSVVTAHWQTSPWMRGLHVETQFANLKCTASHLVLTDRGWVAAGDLRRGEHVYTASHDRGRKAPSRRKESAVVGDRSSRATAQREAPAASDRIQQDEGCGTLVSGSAQTRGRTVDGIEQEPRSLRGRAPERILANALAQSSGRQSSRDAGIREGDASRADARQYALEEQGADERRHARCCEQAHDGQQSDEGARRRRENARDVEGSAWGGLLVALVQAPVARGAHQRSAAVAARETRSERAHEGREPDEGCGNRREGSPTLYAGVAGDGIRSHETDVGRRQDYARDVHGQGQRQGREQDRATAVSDAALSSRPVRRGWHVLDQGDGKRHLPQSGFHLRERQAEGRVASPWNVLASRSADGSSGDRGLPASGMEPVRSLDAPHLAMDDAVHQGRDQDLVGRDRILSIEDAGYSAVYDLECRPHHNFVAGGIVVHNCYASLQASADGGVITRQQAFDYLDDAAEIGVKGVSIISDGESTEVPYFAESVEYGAKAGLQIGTSSNGIKLTPQVLEQILPSLSYLRFNFSGGDRKRYAEIMGLKQIWFDRVIEHVKAAMAIKRRLNLSVNINMQFVVMPQDADQILPFARLAKEIRPDYAILKHTADSADKALGVDYRQYSALFPLFEEAESLGDESFRVAVKWSRIQDEGKRDYQRCYGPPFILQMSGSGLIAPCGQKFQERYKKFHIGWISGPHAQRFRDIYQSDRYWEVLRYLASDDFDAQKMCGENCLQTNTNSWLNKWVGGRTEFPTAPAPPQMGFL